MKKTIFQKLNKKTFILLGLIAFFFALNLFYNHIETSAQNTIVCETEIPIGESLEKAAETLQGIQNEIGAVNMAVYGQIAAANRMIDLALECDINRCSPACSPYPCNPYDCDCHVVGSGESATVVCSTCHSACCNAPDCNGSPCDNNKIHQEYNKVELGFNQIKGSSKRIKNIFKNKTEVEEKLYDARQKFDDCASFPSDWAAIERGEKSPTYLLSCPIVLEENFARKEEECKSLFNFFCCR